MVRLRHMASSNWLTLVQLKVCRLTTGTKPLPEPLSMRPCGLRLIGISQEMLKISILNWRLEFTYLGLQWHLPGTSEWEQFPVARIMGPTWGPPGSYRPHVGPCRPHEPCYQGISPIMVFKHPSCSPQAAAPVGSKLKTSIVLLVTHLSVTNLRTS